MNKRYKVYRYVYNYSSADLLEALIRALKLQEINSRLDQYYNGLLL